MLVLFFCFFMGARAEMGVNLFVFKTLLFPVEMCFLMVFRAREELRVEACFILSSHTYHCMCALCSRMNPGPLFIVENPLFFCFGMLFFLFCVSVERVSARCSSA